MNPLNVAIAGCGPAGLAAALLLRRDGHRVTLFERFDAPRPLGSGLMIQPVGLAVLRAMGLGEALLAQGARIDRLHGRAGRRTVLDVRYSVLGPDAFGIGVHRATLFAILHGAVAAAGIPIETGRTITRAALASDGQRLLFQDGSTAGPFDLLVDALGVRSILTPPTTRALRYGALWASLPMPANFDSHALQQRYVAGHTMAGVLPIGRLPGQAGEQAAFFWSIRSDKLPKWRIAGLPPWKEEVAALWPEVQPLLDAITDPAQLTYASYAHRTLDKPVEQALIHIGDAWHATSPQLGQGANMALLDAWALAKALREQETLPDALSAAAAMRERHVRRYQAMSHWLTPVYQSDGKLLPLLRDWLVGPFARIWPIPRIQAAMVAGVVGNPLASLGL
jgi:2-polyprenyl-6-methoxyphenol hydroxylase-like FAD-dependent oxidoreductase